MQKPSLTSKIFIAAVVTIGAATLARTAVHWKATRPAEFLALLAMTLIASRLKVKLPGVNGTMSVNLPFLLIVAVELSSSESLAIAALASLVQSMPLSQRRTTPVQAAFNAATITNAVAVVQFACSFASQRGFPLPLSVATAGTAFFIANTLSMALVLWLAEGAAPFTAWRRMAVLSTPYYTLSAGLAAIVCAARQLTVWGLSLALLPLMYAIYTSYRRYFAERVMAPVAEHKPFSFTTVNTPSASASLK